MRKAFAVIICDPHFDVYSKFNKQLANGKNSRAKLLIDEVIRIFDYAVENNIENVFILGDVLNSAEVIKTALFNDVVDLFSYGKQLGLNIIIIAGNHDYFSYHEHSALHSLKNIVHIIDGESYTTKICNFKMTFVPYTVDGESLSNIDNDGDILFCHQSVNGVQLGSYELVKQKDAIDAKKLFKKFDVIISGHIHKKQICDGVIFPGSIAQKDFGDEGINKYFSVLYDDYGDLSIGYLPTQHPNFFVIDYLEGDDREAIRYDKNAGLEDVEKDFIKVKASKDLWGRLSQTTYKDKNVIVELKPDKKITAVRIKIDDLSDNKKALNNYLSFVCKDDVWVLKHKKELLKKGLEYLE